MTAQAPATATEPVTKAGDELLTDIIQDHEAPSYHVIERIRWGILDIEAQGAAAERAAIRATIHTDVDWINPLFYGDEARIAVADYRRRLNERIDAILDAREPSHD